MDIKNIIDNSRNVHGVVTIADAMDRLNVGDFVFILVNNPENLGVVKGTLDFIQHTEDDDIQIIVQFAGIHHSIIRTLKLGTDLNGRSSKVGDEEDNNLTRIFTDVDSAILYFKQVQFVREIMALERTSSVSSFISKLLSTRQRPPKE